MTTDTITLIGLGLVGLFIVWLGFSLLKKVVGLALLGALVFGGVMVWNNPDLRQGVLSTIAQITG